MVDDLEWDGQMFPRATDADGAFTNLPDAYPCRNATLPHQHPNLQQHFPSAIAGPALPESEEVEDRTLEDEEVKIGIGSNSEEMRRREAGARTLKEEALEVKEEDTAGASQERETRDFSRLVLIAGHGYDKLVDRT